jgi:rod shape-determining protein MreC
VLVIFAAFLWVPTPISDRVQNAISSVFSPLFYLSTRLQGSYGFLKSRIQSYARLQDENMRLQQLHAELSLKLAQLHEVEVQNRQYREMLDYKDRSDFELVAAKVISRNPVNWWQSIIIDKGTEDGVKENSPVLTAQGLVGKVTQVMDSESQVLLLVDNNFEVSVIFQESGQHGIARGRGVNPLDLTGDKDDRESTVLVTYIDSRAKLKANDRVFTSGLGGVFPQGIYLGEVTKVILPQNASQIGLYQEALVKPAIEFSRLVNVFVNLGKAGKVKTKKKRK